MSCSSTSANSDRSSFLKRCSACQLIFYCGKIHQKLHWQDHKSLCKAISIIKKTKQISVELEEDRKSIIPIVESVLNRALTEEEKEIFELQKVCFVCKKEDHDNFYSIEKLTKYSKHVTNREIKEELFRPIFPLYSRFSHPWMPKYREISVSEHLCLPRTFFGALLKLGDYMIPQILFHVSGASFINEFMNSWEAILHWLPKLIFLKIVFFEQSSDRRIQYLDLCSMCRFWEVEEELFFETRRESYEDYLDDPMYQAPKIVTFINVNPPDDDKRHCRIWKKLIKTWNRLKCALVITTATQENLDLIKERIRSDLISFEIIFDGLNDCFKSLVNYYDKGEGGTVSKASKFAIICKPAGILTK